MFTLTRSSRAFVIALAVCAAVTAIAQETESPRPIGPGKFLFEIDGLRLSFNRPDGAGGTIDALGVASSIVSAGLTPSLDLQLGLDLFLRERITSRGARDSRSGVGDVALRVKWMFWRDDAAASAVAFVPYVRIPSGERDVGSDAVEGGFILPLEFTVAGFTTGAMFQWDHVRNAARNGYDAYWTASGYMQRRLWGGLYVYGEAVATVPSTGFADRDGRLGGGVVLPVSKRLSLDYEIQRGITRAAADWTHTWRVNWEW